MMQRSRMGVLTTVLMLLVCHLSDPGKDFVAAQEASGATSIRRVWPDQPPAWTPPTQPEADTSGPDADKVAGRGVIRLGNVATPELHVYPAAAGHRDAASTTVIVCPGGGYSILAWDLEGTEVAAWLNSIGVDCVVLKYRVPTRAEPQMWLPPVQDIQRTIALIRGGMVKEVAATHVGVLGFSAGGNAAARVMTSPARHYDAIDAADQTDHRPDFGVLIYPAWLVRTTQQPGATQPTATVDLIDDLVVDAKTPPAFFAHAIDDQVSCLSSVAMFTAMKRHDVPASLHVFSSGAHGFGLRSSGGVTDQWPSLCAAWMRDRGFLAP